MKLKVKTNFDHLPKEYEAAKKLNRKGISVGVIGEQAWLAGIHEYGCRIEVTPKMRAYLHSQGLHLKNSTKEIVIPERSFLRTGFDESHREVLDLADALLRALLDGTLSAEQFLDAVGVELRDRIIDHAEDLRSPANHPFTVERKDSSNPLVDSGSMVNAIEYEVTEE